MTQFIIVRHGNTFAANEPPRRIGARTDLPLTATGEEQARALGAYFASKGWHFTRALTSPLLRTKQTAQAILLAQSSAIAAEDADFLVEIDHGPDENKSEEDVLARWGADALTAWDIDAVQPNDWIVDGPARLAAWRELFAREGGNEDQILLVTSNGAARFALQASIELQAAAKSLANLKLPTGSFGLIQRDHNGVLDLPVWGQRP